MDARNAVAALGSAYLLCAGVGCNSAHDAGAPNDAGSSDAGEGLPATGGAPSSGGTNGEGGASSTGGARATGGASSGGNGGASQGSGGRAGVGGGMRPVASTCAVTPAAAPATAWVNATGNLAGMPSECGNLTLLATDPCTNRVIAGVAKGGLWVTTNGTSWSALGTGAGSASIVHRPSSIVFDPEHADVFYESGIYGNLNDGIYKTSDRGTTFTHLGTIGHNDLVSVDFSDPDRKTLLAGAHETKQRLYLSTNGGVDWVDIGPKLPQGSHFSSAPLVLDATHFLLGACGWGDGTCGVFISSDSGNTWASASSESPAGRPLWAADGHLVWTTLYDSGAILSSDLGKTWSSKVSGPHTGFPVELPDGRIVAVGGDHLVISTDGGKTWNPIGETLPYAPAGVTYSTSAKTFYVWRNDCGNAVLSDAVMSAGFDYEKP